MQPGGYAPVMAKKKREKPKKPRRPHDPTHRRIFTHARTIEEILRRFTTGPWAAQLDFSTLELVPAHYVSRFLSQRESDIVWKVRYGPDDDDWFFVYILMELQSSVRRFMALRLWVTVLVWCASGATSAPLPVPAQAEAADAVAPAATGSAHRVVHR